MLACPVRPAMPISAFVDSGYGCEPVDRGIGDCKRRVADVDYRHAWTSPTLTPLKSTALPRPSPEAEPGMRTRNSAVSPRSPIAAVQ